MQKHSELLSFFRWIISNIDATGSTDFRQAFDTGLGILQTGISNGHTSGCNRAVLFMSDGVPNSWATSDDSWLQAQVAAAGSPVIMTYALGSGADPSVRFDTLTLCFLGIFHLVVSSNHSRDLHP